MSSDDEIVVVGDSTINECETKKRKQSDISSFFSFACVHTVSLEVEYFQLSWRANGENKDVIIIQ